MARRVSSAGGRLVCRFLALAILPLAGCGFRPTMPPPAGAEAQSAFDVSRTEPLDEEEEEGLLAVDPRVREENLRRRFPGVRALDLVKVVISAEDRAGACWTELPAPWNTDIEVTYRLRGKPANEASGFRALKEQGWSAVYRTPYGTGLERRASFASIDLSVGTGFVCRCLTRDGVEDGERRRSTLRLRWSEGGVPEVSASEHVAGERRGLRPALVSGRLVTYEFSSRSRFPEGRAGTCGVRYALQMLVEPPVL